MNTINTIEKNPYEVMVNELIPNEYPIFDGTTEEYFMKTTKILNDKLFKPAGHDLEKAEWKLQFSLGYAPNKRANGKSQGSCWSSLTSKDGKTRTIFIHPCQLDNSTPETVAQAIGICTHELTHFVLPQDEGHGKNFKNLGEKVLLEGKPTSMDFEEKGKQFALENIISKIGRFPFEKFTGKAKKQTTRNVKVWCEDCGFKFNTSRAQIKRMTNFSCPTECGGTLEHDQDLSE